MIKIGTSNSIFVINFNSSSNSIAITIINRIRGKPLIEIKLILEVKLEGKRVLIT